MVTAAAASAHVAVATGPCLVSPEGWTAVVQGLLCALSQDSFIQVVHCQSALMLEC